MQPRLASLLSLLVNTPNWIQAEVFAFAVASVWHVLTLQVFTQLLPSLDRSSQATLDKAAPTSPVAETTGLYPCFSGH